MRKGSDQLAARSQEERDYVQNAVNTLLGAMKREVSDAEEAGTAVKKQVTCRVERARSRGRNFGMSSCIKQLFGSDKSTKDFRQKLAWPGGLPSQAS